MERNNQDHTESLTVVPVAILKIHRSDEHTNSLRDIKPYLDNPETGTMNFAFVKSAEELHQPEPANETRLPVNWGGSNRKRRIVCEYSGRNPACASFNFPGWSGISLFRNAIQAPACF